MSGRGGASQTGLPPWSWMLCLMCLELHCVSQAAELRGCWRGCGRMWSRCPCFNQPADKNSVCLLSCVTLCSSRATGGRAGGAAGGAARGCGGAVHAGALRGCGPARGPGRRHAAACGGAGAGPIHVITVCSRYQQILADIRKQHNLNLFGSSGSSQQLHLLAPTQRVSCCTSSQALQGRAGGSLFAFGQAVLMTSQRTAAILPSISQHIQLEWI